MDTSDDARSYPVDGFELRHVDLFGRKTPAKQVHELAYSRPDTFEELLKAIANGDRATQAALFRIWGIR